MTLCVCVCVCSMLRTESECPAKAQTTNALVVVHRRDRSIARIASRAGGHVGDGRVRPHSLGSRAIHGCVSPDVVRLGQAISWDETQR